MQGSAVALWLAAVDRASGLVYADPELLFLGELDVPTLKSGPSGRSLEYEVVSVFERLFDNDEGARLVPAFHKSIRSEEHTSELQSLMRISYAVFCLKKKNTIKIW